MPTQPTSGLPGPTRTPPDTPLPDGLPPVVAAIAGLLRTWPGPATDPAATPEAVAAWLTAKARLLEQVTTATADPNLAARAAACAVRARAAIGSPVPTVTAAGSTEGAPR